VHKEAYAFVAGVVGGLDLRGKRVLEIGSLDVNGSVRPLFAGASDYIGIDLTSGRGVDLVGDAEEFDGRGEFDVVVCCEVLEHTRKPEGIIQSARRALKGGGWLILTCASDGRDPHSTRGGPLAGECYANLDVGRVGQLFAEGWASVTIDVHLEHHDIYVTAQKDGK